MTFWPSWALNKTPWFRQLLDQGWTIRRL